MKLAAMIVLAALMVILAALVTAFSAFYIVYVRKRTEPVIIVRESGNGKVRIEAPDDERAAAILIEATRTMSTHEGPR